MAFNFANFSGGAVDQWNTERELSMRDRQVANQEREAADLQLSRQLARTQAENQQKQEEALRRADVVLAESVANVGKMVDVPGAAEVVPAEKSPFIEGVGIAAGKKPQPSALLDIDRPAASPQQSVPAFGVGGYRPVQRMYQQSDAMKDAAAKLAADPLTAGVANKLMAGAQQARFGEAFQMAAQQGDLTGAARHLSGRNDVSVETDDKGGVRVLDGSGKTLDSFSSRDEYLRSMAAHASPQALETYKKNEAAAIHKQAENERRAAADRERFLLGVGQIQATMRGQDMRYGGGDGSAGGSGSGGGLHGGSSRGGGDGADFMKYSDFNSFAKNVKTPDGGDIDAASAYALGERLRRANPNGLSSADAAQLALNVASGKAQLKPWLNAETGIWHEAVYDPGAERPIPTNKSVDVTTYGWVDPARLKDSDGKPLEGEARTRAIQSAKQDAGVEARKSEAAFVESLKQRKAPDSAETDYEAAKALAASPDRTKYVAALRQKMQDPSLSESDRNQASRVIQASGILAQQRGLPPEKPALKASSTTASATAADRINEASAAGVEPGYADRANVVVGGVASKVGGWIGDINRRAADGAARMRIDSVKRVNASGEKLDATLAQRIKEEFPSFSDENKRLMLEALTSRQADYLGLK